MFDNRIIVNGTPDPSFESSDPPLTGRTGTGSNVSGSSVNKINTDSTDRAQCAELTATILAGPSAQMGLRADPAHAGYCRPGEKIAAGADIKLVTSPSSNISNSLRVRVAFWQLDRTTFSAVASSILLPTLPAPDNNWHRIEGVVTVPSDAWWYSIEALCVNTGATTGAWTVRVDSYMGARFDSVVPYFDGASLGGHWDDEADKSTSWRWNYDLASPMGDELFEGFAPVVEAFGDPNDNLRDYCRAMGRMIQPIDDIARDGDNGEAGYSQLLDLTRAKGQWLPWLGQFVGYRVPDRRPEQDRESYLDIERGRTITRSAHRRGTIARMVEEVQSYLNDPKTVFVQQRVGTAHRLTIFYYTAMLNPNFTAGQLAAAAQAQKAKGLILTVTPLSGGDWNTLIANQATWNVVKTKFANWNEVISNPAKP